MDHLKFKLKHGTIGPAHDPYGSTLVEVTNTKNGWGAEWYEDGLGSRRIKLWNGDQLIREKSWVNEGPNSERIAANAIKHFQAWIGYTPGTCRDEAERREAATWSARVT